ncbi:hypothetical protein OCU04_000338 [Sclerotinia nivalis]|uniref:Uncharacterized protein n=1 Tax=Sclerotinia nivalis TaxID=352851 RepID=A0A9X0AVX4_9HELO|nr:hypothetical protein OCU04_000338 [Sclerotinia nivalis]
MMRGKHKFIKYCPRSREEKRESISYSVYASECMLLPGFIEQSVTLDIGTHEGRKRFLRYSITYEVETDTNSRSGHRDGEYELVYGGNSQAHRLGKTKPGKMRSFLKTLERLHREAQQTIENNCYRFKKLDYISAILQAALRKGSLLVHQHKLELLEHSRNAHQARFIKPGVRLTERQRTKKETRHERREVRRDKTFGRINESRVARGFGIQLSNNEKRSHKRHERMRRPSHSDAGSTSSWETASNADFSPGSSRGRRHRGSSRSYDGHSSRYDEDDSSDDDDDDDTRSHASTVFSKPSHSSSSGSSRSSASSSRSGRSNSEYGSRYRSGNSSFETNEQLREPPRHPPDFKHGYGTIPPQNLPYPNEPYPGRNQPYYPYDYTADYAHSRS